MRERHIEKFEWNSTFETGIEKIDKQHKALFQTIDALSLAIYQGRSAVEVNEMISFLDSYVDEHFRDEEALMRSNEYPAYYDHKSAHKGFTALFENLKKDLARKGPDSYLAIRVEKEIRRWWELHIMNMDKKYVPYMKNL